MVFYTYAFWVPMSLLPALFVWRWPHGIDWLWLLATGLFGTLGQLLWTHALRLGEVSALTPISFTQLPLVALFGWWLFDETPDGGTVLGALVILGANAYIAHREAVLARRAADPGRLAVRMTPRRAAASRRSPTQAQRAVAARGRCRYHPRALDTAASDAR